ncbi:unnamed protein product [Eruca vesicaria subsp. sativa]|uniref:Uncharacterized protein n=1 Tax=Eruca vesicaria subsp. sativa TaxID=29727 RepID=A0ABC8LN79_ERUVS|nr:unnamed protein product [Eruca vesicaria subsp. sativa]
MPYYTKDNADVDDYDEYDPTPYSGGYDITVTYGRPLPPSDENCYPLSSLSGDAFEYQRPVFSSSHEPSAYDDQALNTEYSSYAKPKTKHGSGKKAIQDHKENSGKDYDDEKTKTKEKKKDKKKDDDDYEKKKKDKDHHDDYDEKKKKKDHYDNDDEKKKKKDNRDGYDEKKKKKDHHDSDDEKNKKKKDHYKHNKGHREYDD